MERTVNALARLGQKVMTIAEATVTPETPMSTDRMAICRQCVHKRKVFTVSQCAICTCVLELKTKHPDEHCPIGKW